MFTFHCVVKRFCEPYHENSIIKDESLEMNFGKLSRNDGIVEERQLISSQFSKSTPLFSIGGD